MCEEGDICKAVVDTPNNFLVKHECQCPYPFTCPSSTNVAKVELIGQGIYKQIQCQRLPTKGKRYNSHVLN